MDDPFVGVTPSVPTISDVDAARRLLEEAGYSVSEQPMPWREYTAVVTLKARSRELTEKRFVQIIEDIVATLLPTRESIEKRSDCAVSQIGRLSVKQGARVFARQGTRKPPLPENGG